MATLSFTIKGRVIVTGASGALGRAVMAQLRAAGVDVAGLDMRAAPEAGVAAADLSDADAAAAAISAAADAAGGALGGLVNVAGGFVWGHVQDVGLPAWRRMFDINVVTAVNASTAALPFLQKGGGAIVNVAAAGARRAAGGMGAYAASKASVSRLTEALAEEMKDKGVRVNAVAPTTIDTPANRADMPDADASRWVTPDALADTIAFLLSDGARAITGAEVLVAART